MKSAELLRPILNDRPRSINFFNGRLLSGEDLTAEQRAQRDRDALLARAVGPGVVCGLELDQDSASSALAAAVLVRPGLAINSRGDLLTLSEEVRLSLTPPTHALAEAEKSFSDCLPPQSGTYVSGEAVYLLSVAPAAAPQGRAPVSGLGGQATPCQAAFRADGVKFRLVEVPVPGAWFGAGDLLRNRVAGLGLGVDALRTAIAHPFGPAPSAGLADQMLADGQLAACEVPLGVLHWTSGQGIRFVDMHSVRRRPKGTPSNILGLLGGATDARAEALMLQFQDQVEWLRRRNLLRTARARTFFEFIPAAGLLPVSTPAWPDGAQFTTFFDGVIYKSLTFVEGARLRVILDQAQGFKPIDLGSGELVRLHPVRENRQALDNAGPGAARPCLLFVTGHAADFSDPHYNVSRFGYANYW